MSHSQSFDDVPILRDGHPPCLRIYFPHSQRCILSDDTICMYISLYNIIMLYIYMLLCTYTYIYLYSYIDVSIINHPAIGYPYGNPIWPYICWNPMAMRCRRISNRNGLPSDQVAGAGGAAAARGRGTGTGWMLRARIVPRRHEGNRKMVEELVV